MAKSRDFGLPAVGKGDKSRVSDPVEFNKNFAAINFTGPGPEGFVKVGHKSVKTYGPVKAEKEFSHFDAVDWCGANERPNKLPDEN